MHVYLFSQYLFCTFSSFFTPKPSTLSRPLHQPFSSRPPHPPPSHSTSHKNKINFPGFFELFPELDIIKWPQWFKKNGKRIKCEKDEDCMFPQACCHHPIVPGDKFCCLGGYKQRALQYVFVPIPIPSEITTNH